MSNRVVLPGNNGLAAKYKIDWGALERQNIEFKKRGRVESSWDPVILGSIPYGERADRDNHGFRNVFTTGSFYWDSGDVRLLVNHEGRALASLRAGTLRLFNEPAGVRFEAVPDDSPEFWDLVLPALEHRLGASPGFDPDLFYRFGGNNGRTIQLARLLEISLTLWPGFRSTLRGIRINTRRLLEISQAPDGLQDRWVRREVYNAQWR